MIDGSKIGDSSALFAPGCWAMSEPEVNDLGISRVVSRLTSTKLHSSTGVVALSSDEPEGGESGENKLARSGENKLVRSDPSEFADKTAAVVTETMAAKTARNCMIGRRLVRFEWRERSLNFLREYRVD